MHYWIARYCDTVDKITIFSSCNTDPLNVIASPTKDGDGTYSDTFS